MRKSIIILLALAASACATQDPAPVLGHRSIPDVKACVAEFDTGFVGTQKEYERGCYRFAEVRF